MAMPLWDGWLLMNGCGVSTHLAMGSMSIYFYATNVIDTVIDCDARTDGLLCLQIKAI